MVIFDDDLIENNLQKAEGDRGGKVNWFTPLLVKPIYDHFGRRKTI